MISWENNRDSASFRTAGLGENGESATRRKNRDLRLHFFPKNSLNSKLF